MAVVLVVGAAAGVAVWLKADADLRAAGEQAAEQRAAEAEKRCERAAEEAQRAAEEAERERRAEAVTDIEKMAKQHAEEDFIDGPVLDVSCSPLGAGSADELTEKTTVFTCFAANKENKDGTRNGYYYNATMNWDTGSYTYGYGAP